MPRTRAYRRHTRHVKLARRHRVGAYYGWPAAHHAMHWHLNCNCFDEPRSLERRREERAWRDIERRAW